ncbi:basic leucine zipper transcriptional factor ATF-like 2 [Cyprinodon tularosa]|uniref:basic leucine zipper transcriptional factor ATF-like 2 n=1 Tax=Cyprinodon tularosa TaxID=77115 RepID=UPI0018E25C7C|nr:basic leucine zipper transcriptional factor ATF-like 2 [Cyprinodon tularosa]
MPLLFMDTGCDLSSPCGSLSADECSSSTSALEREGEGNKPRPRVTKRREKNRDAARKSRYKQTKRADELHEELQHLEQSNSALRKEIATLKKDLCFYETSLEHHKPHCRLKDPALSPAGCKANPSSFQASNLPPIKTSVGFNTFINAKKTHLSSLLSSKTTTGPAAASSNKLLVTSTSSSSTSPYSVSFSTHPAPHSLFCNTPLIPDASFSPCTAAQILTKKVHTISSAKDAVLGNPESSFSTEPTLYSHSSPPAVQDTCLPQKSSQRNACQLPLCKFSGNGAPPQTPTPPSPLVPSPAPYFTSMQSHIQHGSPGAESLLSMLTVPSPLNHSLTTSSSFNQSFSQPAPDPPGDIPLSELLKDNEWILGGLGDNSFL